jgi:hypothetical protein
MTTRVILSLIAVVGLVSACNSVSDGSPPSAGSTASAPSSSPSGVRVSLDGIDKRIPVPLGPMMANHQKQNMRDHLLAVQEIATALAAKDFSAVEKSAGRIGYSEQMGQMCTHMGAGAPGFTDAALNFHRTADTIADAAKKQDPDAVLSALSRTLATCTGCHATFKQQVVDDGTWSSLTKQTAPSGSMHP